MEQAIENPFAERLEFQRLLMRLREELELGDRHRAGMAFAIVELEDTVPEEGAEVIRERLLKRAFSATQHSIRHQRGLARKIADFAIRIDRYLFISLGSVSAGTLRVPLGRIVNQMRTELYSTPNIHAMRLRRRLSMGVAHWLPEVGFLTEQMMFAKAWQAFQQAKTHGGMADPSGFLGLSPSNLDTMQIEVYDWGQTQVVPKSRAATGELPAASAKKTWQFWK